LNYNGTTTPVPYSVCDNGTPLPAQCATATITVTVTPVNDPPVAVNDVATTPEDTPVTFPVTSNDTDVDGAINPATLDLDPTTAGIQTTFTVAGQGTFVANPVTGAVTFTPVLNYTGTTTPIPYSVCDNGTPLPAQCATATITVTVTPTNDPPTITQTPVTTPEDTPIVICPTIADPDPGNVLTISLCNAPLNGMAVVGPGNCITFTPAPNFNGVTTVCIQVCDQGPLCATVDVPVTVTPVNDPPVAVNDNWTTPEDTPVSFNILTNDFDVDGMLVPSTVDLDPSTPGIQTTFTIPGQGTFVVDPVTGIVTFTPVPNYSGITTPIPYSVCDNGTPLPALCATATISVVVIFDPIAKLQLKVMLQGALIGTSNGLMRDDLRSGGYIPLTEPYGALAVAGNTRFTHVGGGGGETTTASVLAANAGTRNAIVDWVFVELRSTLDSSVVLLTRSALVQRDGDVVSPSDGVSRLNFTGIVGQQYFVSVKHRNHIGAMTSSRVTMNNDSTLVNFTTATNAQVYNRPGAINYDGFEMVTVQGMRALWAGNTNANTKVKYQGSLSDNTSILTQSLNHPNNTLGTYNFNSALGYYSGDVNLDGRVKYQGTANDASYVFVNVIGLYTVLNTAGLYNYDLFLEQLP
jgi:CshA-type fibril repeat protein